MFYSPLPLPRHLPQLLRYSFPRGGLGRLPALGSLPASPAPPEKHPLPTKTRVELSTRCSMAPGHACMSPELPDAGEHVCPTQHCVPGSQGDAKGVSDESAPAQGGCPGLSLSSRVDCGSDSISAGAWSPNRLLAVSLGSGTPLLLAAFNACSQGLIQKP